MSPSSQRRLSSSNAGKLSETRSCEVDLCEDMVRCTERIFKNRAENYFLLKQGGGRLLEDGCIYYPVNYGNRYIYIYIYTSLSLSKITGVLNIARLDGSRCAMFFDCVNINNVFTARTVLNVIYFKNSQD